MKKTGTVLTLASLLICGAALAAPSAQNSDAVAPNSPLKELGFPDAGTFNPNGDGLVRAAPVVMVVPAPPPTYTVAPAAMTYYPPAIVITERPRRPYALVAAPTLPCAPAYCPRRVRVDRN